jgi:hypothetical protein
VTDAWLEWLPVLVAAAALAVAVLILLLVRLREHAARKSSPFADDFTRAPGHSLRRATEAAYRVLWRAIVGAIAWPLLVYAAWASLHLLAEAPRSQLLDLAFSGALLLGFAWALVRLFRAESRFRRLRFSLDGEIATGQMLAGALGQGCRLVHDVSVPGGRIAHVLVAPVGVHAISTIARSASARGRQGVTVTVEGDELRFPGGSDTRTVPRARKSAQLLADRLRAALGHAVQVRAAVALPGWLVERRGASDVTVLNPREGSRLLAGAAVLPAAEVDEIAATLEGMAPPAAREAPPREALPERREPRLE